MAIRRAEYDYLLPSVLGDELLLGTWIASSDGKLTMQRRFQLINPRARSTVMRGCWDLVCIEISSGRPRRMPPTFSGIYLPAMIGADQDAPAGTGE
jgi:acyl-CoA thioester hydrolase